MAKDKKKVLVKNKEKGTIIWLVSVLIGLILILLALLIAGNIWSNNEEKPSNNDEYPDNIIYNEDKNVVGDKEVGDVTFTNIECSFDGFRSLLKYTITNNGTSSITLGDYEIVIKDSEDNILAIMVPGDVQELQPGDVLDTGNVIDIDLSSVSSIELQLSGE